LGWVPAGERICYWKTDI